MFKPPPSSSKKPQAPAIVPGASPSGGRRGRFSSEWIQQLKDQASVIDVVSENVDLKKTGNRYMGRCPFHGDRSPSFSVSKDFYYCFGCKESGDAISFLMNLHGLSFEEACEDLAEKFEVKIPESAYQLTSDQEKALMERRKRLQQAARLNHFVSLKLFHQNLLRPSGAGQILFQEAQEYLKKRGVSQAMVEQFQVGVSSGQSDSLVQFLKQAKAPLALARDFGLIRPSQKHAGDYDFFRERITFPLIDVRGRVCGFGGRILPSCDRDQMPKYLNSAENDLFQKSKFLYGLYHARKAIRETETAVVVEGYFDVIGLHQHGFENVVATCGTSLTEDHLKMLSRLAKRVIVFFDQDAAGQNATIKAMELGLSLGMLVYGIPYESQKDPDEFLLEDPEANRKKLEEWMTQAYPLLDGLIEQKMSESENDVEMRTQAIKQITTWLERYDDPVGRSVRLQSLVQKWKVPQGAIRLSQQSQFTSQLTQSSNAPAHYQAQSAPPQRSHARPPQQRAPLSSVDRQLIQFFMHHDSFAVLFQEALDRMPEKDSRSVLFTDTTLAKIVAHLERDFGLLKHYEAAPDGLAEKMRGWNISEELQSVILEALLKNEAELNGDQLEALLHRAVYQAWVRFSHRIQEQIRAAEIQQDTEKVEELSKQFLDVQIKLNEFKDSYVSGKSIEDR